MVWCNISRVRVKARWFLVEYFQGESEGEIGDVHLLTYHRKNRSCVHECVTVGSGGGSAVGLSSKQLKGPLTAQGSMSM